MRDRSTTGKPKSPPHTPAVKAGAARVVHSWVTPAQRQALQQLLFTSSDPAHSLGQARERYRVEHLDVPGTLAPRTVDWRLRASYRLSDWDERPVTATYRDAAVELYKRHGQAGGSQATNTLGRILILCRSWGWRHDDHDLRGLARVRSNPRTEIVSADHRPALLAALEAIESPRRKLAADVARLLLLTGMRLHEATSIRWSNVSVSERYVVLPKTKNGRARLVPLCDTALAIITAQPRVDDFVFPAKRSGRHIHDSSIGHVITMACEAAGIPRTIPHVLRHTWATEAMRAGVSDQVAMLALGHSSPVELQRYQHAVRSDVAAAMDIVGERIAKLKEASR